LSIFLAMRELYRFIVVESGRRQILLGLISLAVAGLSMAPLELQRRIVNDAIGERQLELLGWLCLAYLSLVLVQSGLKFCMRLERGRIAEEIIRRLRTRAFCRVAPADDSASTTSSEEGGKAASIIAQEVNPLGGFVGEAVSVPLAEGGMLVAIFGYMLYVEPAIALAALGIFSLQMLVVPFVQRAINRRTEAQIGEVREVTGAVSVLASGETDGGDNGIDANQRRIDRIFALKMQTFRLKYALKAFINGLNHLSTVGVLGVGGWMVIEGTSDVGTVVAFLSGMERVSAPWRELVAFFRTAMDAALKCRLIRTALEEIEASGRT